MPNMAPMPAGEERERCGDGARPKKEGSAPRDRELGCSCREGDFARTKAPPPPPARVPVLTKERAGECERLLWWEEEEPPPPLPPRKDILGDG